MSRKNSSLLDWLRALLIALATYAGLNGLQFGPAWGAAALALAAGGLSLASTEIGLLIAVVGLALPLMAVSAITGVLFLIVALFALRYLASSRGAIFLVIAGGIAGVVFGPAWAAVALAGFLLGPTEGALAAGTAVVVAQAYGFALGKGALGVVAAGGGSKALLDLSKVPASLFSAKWVSASFGSLSAKSVEAFGNSLSQMDHVGVLIAQPLLWAGGAALAGVLAKNLRDAKRPLLAPIAVAAGVLVPAIGALVLQPLLGFSASMDAVLAAAAVSLVVSLLWAFAAERLFPEASGPVRLPARSATVAAEDADVDELLRLIATAEDKLAAQHTTNSTVMITDMKSFSKMTEEDGSILTAKAIQRHRDLLVPIIERHGGHGKSTGGDGLVASFPTSSLAIEAAVDMQRALGAYNSTHPDEREMTVRIGIADGEVVLDRGGRPFIGAGLNLAARVMNLADGGQIFTTSKVASTAPSGISIHSHGPFSLKNIAESVDVVEVLWREGQRPIDPREQMIA